MKTLKLLTLLAVAGAAQTAFAADGSIQFKGKVVDQTCKFEGTGGGNQVVTLPTVPKSELANANDTAGDTPFQLKITDCAAQPRYKIRAFFNGANIESNLLKNTATDTPAGNVNLALYNASGSQIMLSSANAVDQNSEAADAPAADGDEVLLNYIVKYYATAPATAGNVSSEVMFDLVYE